MFIAAVLRSLPLPWPWSPLCPSALRLRRTAATAVAPPVEVEQGLQPGQSLMLKLARGSVLHVDRGEIAVEDAPALWADHCWPQPLRLRAGEVWVVPRTGWWRLDGRASRHGVARFICRAVGPVTVRQVEG